jgi:predicted dehydrogenase
MSGLPAVLPTSRVPDSMDAPPLRWGVIGTGWIAQRFIRSLQRHTRQQVAAVGSRTEQAARRFADTFAVPIAYGSYEALVADPQIDVVYVATPHNVHHPCALLALNAGKHVLVEKPLALNATQAAEIADLAARQGVFCMEALWTFFLPKFDVIAQLLADGVLGELRSVIADHGEFFTPDHRIMRHDLAGGPLLDLGTYPIALAVAMLGEPQWVHASGQPAPSGVNGQASAILTTPGGNQSVIHTTLFSNTPTTATIAGTDATLTLAGPFFTPGDFVLTSSDQQHRLEFTEPKIGHDGLHFQAAEVARRIGSGERESPVRPLADSIATLRVVDEIRRQLGIVFNEEAPIEEGAVGVSR